MSTSSAYGASWFSILWANIKDRLRGQSSRANARRGYIRPPIDPQALNKSSRQGKSQVIWIKTDGDYTSVLLAAELLGAIRQKRLDVRLVLTFEDDYPEIYRSRFRAMAKIGVGYDVCDLNSALVRALERLEPLGVITVGKALGNNLVEQLHQKKIHSIAFQTSCGQGKSFPAQSIEASYPAYHSLKPDKEMAAYQAEPTDMTTLVVNPQVEPTLGKALGLTETQSIYWAHLPKNTSNPLMVQTLLKLWRDSGLSEQHFLCLSMDDSFGQGLATLEQWKNHKDVQVILLSQWDRQPLKKPHILLMDEARWMPALSSIADACYVHQYRSLPVWQIIASGTQLYFERDGDFPLPVQQGGQCKATSLQDWVELISRGEKEKIEIESRNDGDRRRKYFWEERRKAQLILDELLQRIYDW